MVTSGLAVSLWRGERERRFEKLAVINYLSGSNRFPILLVKSATAGGEQPRFILRDPVVLPGGE